MPVHAGDAAPVPDPAVVVLYGMPISAGTRLARWAADVAGVAVQFETVDLMNGEHKTDAFGALTRGRHCVPALVHGALRLTESRAIAAYLLRLGDEAAVVDGNVADPVGAVADEWVHYEATCLYGRVSAVAYFTLFGLGHAPGPEDADDIRQSLAYVDARIAETPDPFLAGAAPTLADLVVAVCLGLLAAVPRAVADLDDYPHIGPWLARVEALGHYAELRAPFDAFATQQMAGVASVR